MRNNFYDDVYYKKTDAPVSLSESARGSGKRYSEFLRKCLPANGSGKLLDIGCGTGTFFESLQGSSYDLWGIDISEIAVDLARRRVSKPEQVVCADADPLPFESGMFDVVTAWGVIEHFHRTGAILQEISRVLKPDGRAVIMVPNIFYYKFLWDALRKGTGPVRHQEPENLFSFMEWKQLIEDNGLTVIEAKRHNKFNKPGLKWLRAGIPFYFSNHFIYSCKVR